MIRGALEFVSRIEVGGWLFASTRDLEGDTVLAFVEQQCVGAGIIGIMRDDLNSAGLGHGRSGFRFRISLDEGTDTAAVVVRLEGSDLSLLHAASIVTRRA